MINAVIVSTNLNHILKETLSRNKNRFGRFIKPFVLTEEGKGEVETAKECNITCHTYPFKSPKNKFMKEAAVNKFYNSGIIDKNEPLLCMDCDIILPTDFDNLIEPYIDKIYKLKGIIWGIKRRQCEIKEIDNYSTTQSMSRLKIFNSDQVWGYFELFLPTTLNRNEIFNEKMDINRLGKLNPDTEILCYFKQYWMRDINCLHLGVTDHSHWLG